MPIDRDIRSDIKAAQKLRWRWWGILSWIALCLTIFALLDHFGRFDLALPTINSILILGVTFAVEWNLRRHVWFWITMTVIVALHVPLILFVPWTSKWVPAVAIAGIDIVDICLIFVIFSVVRNLTEGAENLRKESAI